MKNSFITDYDRDRVEASPSRRCETRTDNREKKLSEHVKKTAEQKAAVKRLSKMKLKAWRTRQDRPRIRGSQNLNMPAEN